MKDRRTFFNMVNVAFKSIGDTFPLRYLFVIVVVLNFLHVLYIVYTRFKDKSMSIPPLITQLGAIAGSERIHFLSVYTNQFPMHLKLHMPLMTTALLLPLSSTCVHLPSYCIVILSVYLSTFLSPYEPKYESARKNLYH